MKLTFTVGEADGQSLRLGFTLADIRSCVPDPAAITAHVGGQLHLGNN